MAETPQDPLIQRQALEEEFGGYVPLRDIPTPPNIPFRDIRRPMPEIGGAGQEPIDPVQAMRAKLNAIRPDQIGIESYSLNEIKNPRYDYFVPGGYNNEDAYGQGQTWAEKMFNGVGKGLVLTGTTFLQGTVGLVNGLINWAADGRFASFYDNALNRGLDEVNKQLDNSYLPNYYTDVEKNSRWYSPDHLFTANFLWNGIVKNLGYAAGAALAGGTYAAGIKAFSSLPGISRLISVGKQAEILAATEAELAAADKVASTYGKIKSLSDRFLTSYELLNPGGRAVVAGLSTSGEAGMEALQNMNAQRDKLIEDYTKTHNGQVPTGEDLNKINRTAESVGNSSFWLNVGLLTATNYIQFPKILGSSYKAEKGMINSMVRETGEIIKEAGQYAVPAAKKGFGKIMSTLNKIRPYTFSTSEAFEEGAQYAIQVGVQDYYNKKYYDKPTNFLKSLSQGITQTFTTDEGMENVLIGGLSGSIMMAHGRYKERGEIARNTTDAVERFNKWQLSDFTKETVDAVNRGTKLQEEREELLRQGDILESKEKETDYIINYLTPRIKYGRYDLVQADINEYRQLANADFSQLVAEGKALRTDTKEAYLQRLTNLETTANNIKSLYQSIILRYGNLVDDEGKPVFTNDVINKMIYAATKVADYDRRTQQLSANLSKYNIDVDDIIDGKVAGNAEPYNKAIAEIEKMEDPDVRDSLARDLYDIGEIGLRRKKMLDEYTEIKKTPEKFQDKDTKTNVPGENEEGKVIIPITTKKGVKNFEVGEEYMVGRVVEKDKDGREVYRAPRITILGKNDDGTIKIKTSEGEIRDLNPNIFPDYNLYKVSDTLDNVTAKFFLENWNTVYKIKLRRDPKTKKARSGLGRLEYNPDTDSLVLVYKNDRGQVREMPVSKENFEPQGEYKEALITEVEKLTPTQQIAKDNFTSRSKSTLVANREATLKMLNDVYNDVDQRQKKVKELIEKKRTELDKISNDLKELEEKIAKGDITTKGAFKASTSRAVRAANKLSRMQEQLKDELSLLEDESDELAMSEDYILNILDKVDEFPMVDSQFIEDLREERSMLHDMVLDTGLEINNVKGLIEKVTSALDTAVNFALDLIKRFESKYPNLPVAPLDLKTFIQNELDAKGIWGEGYETYMKVNPDLMRDLYEFDRELADIDELDVKPNERTLNELQKKMEDLVKDLDRVSKELKAKDNVISRFEAVHNKYESQKREEEEMASNDVIMTTLINSDERSVQTKTYSPTYKVSAKKTNYAIVRSTVAPPSELPYHKRAVRFGARMETLENASKIRGVLITQKTEGDFGLGEDKEKGRMGLMQYLKDNSDVTPEEKALIQPGKTIAMLAVELGDDNVLRPVDEFGNVIENPTIDNVIFQVYPTPALKWSKKYGGADMFREGTLDENKAYYRAEYTKWTNRVLELDKPEVHTVSPSFGIPVYATILDQNNNPIKDESAVVTPEEAGLISEKDLTERSVIFIPTTNKDIRKGSTYYEDVLGIPFISLSNGNFPLQNQKFTEKKANVIFSAIRELSKRIVADPTLESDESKRLYNWLKSVVYWGTPQNSVGRNSIFFDRTEEGLRLFMTDDTSVTYPFTPNGLLNNKSAIIEKLVEMYPNINYTIAREGGEQTNNRWREPYEEILEIDENGEVQSKLWTNYQTYLLSRKGRANEDIPFFTQLRPITPTNPINREGIYFTISDMPDAYKDGLKKTTTSTLKPVAEKPKAGEKPAPLKISQMRKAPINEIILEPDVVNTLQSAKGEKLKISFLATPDAVDPKNERALQIVQGEDIEKVLDQEKAKITDADVKRALNKDNPTTEEIEKTKTALAREAIKNNIREIIKTKLEQQEKEAGKLSSDGYMYFTGEEEQPVKPEEMKPKEQAKVEVKRYTGEEVEKEEAPVKPATIQISREQQLRNQMNNLNADEAALRSMVKDRVEKYKSENWYNVAKWLKENFPNIPVYRVKNILTNTNGLQAWGMFKDGAIYLLENAEVGTIYHEVFEAVWKMFTDANEQAAVLNEFKSRKGTFTDYLGKTVSYSEASPLQAKEQLAEEFRDYVLNKKIPAKPTEGRPFILKLFADLYNFIKEFFTGRNAQVNTANLFDRIGRGYYKDYNPFNSTLSFGTRGFIDGIEEVYADHFSEFRIKNVPANQVHDMMEHMTYKIFRKLVSDNKSLFNIPNYSKREIYDYLKKDLIDTLLLPGKAAQDLAKKNVFTNEEAEQEVEKCITLAKRIEDDWDEMVETHVVYMKKYSIEFDENDEATLTDEDASKKGDYQEATKIDVFKKANSAVKLLISTIPLVDENGNFIRTSMGTIQMAAPMSKVFMSLMNNLHTSRSVDDMLDKIHEMAKTDRVYKYVYTRLTNPMSFDQDTPSDITKLNNVYDGQLITALWYTFKKQSPDVRSVFIFENGDVEIGDSNLASAAVQVRNEYESNMAKVLRTTGKYFTYRDKERVYVGNPKGLEGQYVTSIPYMVEFLKTLGIRFSVGEILRLEKDKVESFEEAARGIYKTIKDKQKIATFSGKVLDIRGHLMTLATVRAAIENPEFDSTFFNVKGERTQTFVGTNASSDLYDLLSQSENITQIQTSGQYKYLITDSFTGTYKNKDGKTVSTSVLMNKMFDFEDGKRKRKSSLFMKPGYVDGTINKVNGKRKQSAVLNMKERLIQELNMNISGFYYNLVPGDASLQYMTYMGNHITQNELRASWDNVYDIFKGYFIAEKRLSKEGRDIPKVEGRNTKDLRFFKPILDAYEPGLHDTIVKDKSSPEEAYDKYKGKIENAVKQFIVNEGKDLQAMLLQYRVVKMNENIRFDMDNLKLDDNMSKEEFERTMQAMSANYIINNIELHKLLYSDPYQYKDELKRIKNFNSPRQAIINNAPKMNRLLEKLWNKDYKKGDVGYTDMIRDYFRTATLSDIMGVMNLKNYGLFKETDGAGIIIFKAYRNFRIRAGQWSDAEERQYKYDIAWEKRDKELPLSSEEEKLLKDGNPKVRSAYTTLKPIVSGNKANGKNYNDVVLDKYSLYPLSYRIMKEINKDANAVKLHDKMQKEDLDYVVFESARKVGADGINPVYDKEAGFNMNPYENITNVPFSILSIQSEVPSKEDELVTRGSQATKLITMDFMQGGVPIDFKSGESFNDRYKEWYSMTEDQKKAYNDGDNLYNEIRNNNELLNALMDEAYESLLKRMGISVQEDGSFKITDISNTARALRDEMLNREVNDNIIDALESFENGSAILESTPAYQQVRNILYSIADKMIVRPKMNGSQKVQLPSALLESQRAKMTEINGKMGYTSDVLKFYVDEDGKRVCQIMVARWFESDKTDAELLDYFNNTEEGKKEIDALFGIAFRIPTQKQNSIERFEIAKFLPVEFGDNVIVSAAIVEKVGSDFDIDKISIYFKNVYTDLNGNIKKVPFFGIGDKAKAALEKMWDEGKFLDPSSKEKLEKFIDGEKTMMGEDSYSKFLLSVPSIVNMFSKEGLTKEFMAIRNKQEFKEKALARLYKQSLENGYTDSMEKFVSHPMNFERLTTPNSAAVLKELAEKIVKLKGGKPFNYTLTGNMLNRRYMENLRHAFVTGKRAIGIAAVNNTNHSLNQRQPIFIDPDRYDQLNKVDKFWLTGGTDDKANIILKFKKFNRIRAKNKMLGTLSFIMDADERYFISDIIGQFIDGYVDISAKGPWIIELGATPNVTGTFLYLVKMGVPIETVAFFMNQPIIRDHLANVENAGYSWLFINDFVEDAMSDYSPKDSKQPAVTEIPSNKALERMIGKDINELDDNQRAAQQFILMEFLKYAKMAEHLFYVTQGSNFDTARINDPFLLYKKIQQYAKAKASVFSGLDIKGNIIAAIDAILDNSFLGNLKTTMGNVRNMFAEILVSDQKNVRSVMHQVLAPFVDLPDGEFVKVAQKAVNDLFDWAVQVDRGFSDYVEDILLSDKNVATEMYDFVNDVQANSNHPLFKNIIINSIKPHFSRGENQPNNLSIVNRDNKVYDQNQIIYGFRELKEYLGSDNKVLYNRLLMLSVLQSGLSRSPISFTSLIPHDDFYGLYNQTLKRLNKMANLQDFVDLKVFERNNWTDGDIVPYRRAKGRYNEQTGSYYYNMNMFFDKNKLAAVNSAMKNKEIPQLLKLDIRSREADSDVIGYTWEKQEELLTEQERKTLGYNERRNKVAQMKREMRKIGDYSYINKGLFQKVYRGGQPFILEEGNEGQYVSYVYKMINAWGDSHTDGNTYFSANEFYDHVAVSPIENGFIKVYNEKTDETILSYFDASPIVKAKEKVQTKPTVAKIGPLEVVRIISGGQTGMDRIGLEVGRELGYETGGIAPPGYYTEKGEDLTLKDLGVKEIDVKLQAGRSGKEFYLPRTEQNVLNSDGTVYFSTKEDSPGLYATKRYATEHGRPFIVNPSALELRNWLVENNIRVLNVAGSRASKMTQEQLLKNRTILMQALNKTPFNSVEDFKNSLIKSC